MGTRSKTRKKTTSKSVTFSSVPAGDRYLDLVRECPLRIIRSESEYGQAIAMLDRLSDLGNDRTADETEYLLSLTVFVKKYEDEHHLMPPVSGVDMLRYLLETHNVTQSSLASATGLAVSDDFRDPGGQAEARAQAHRRAGAIFWRQAGRFPERLIASEDLRVEVEDPHGCLSDSELGGDFEEPPYLSQPEQAELPSLSVRERGLAARDPDKCLVHRTELGRVLAQPLLKGFQFPSNDVDCARVGGVDLDPIDDLCTQVRRLISDCVVPLSLVAIPGFEATLHVDASLDT